MFLNAIVLFIDNEEMTLYPIKNEAWDGMMEFYLERGKYFEWIDFMRMAM